MDGKLWDEFIKPINLSLEIVYCSTTLSNNDLIRFKKFVSELYLNYGMNFISYPSLILLINN